VTKLAKLTEMAELVHDPEFRDNAAPAQLRAWREVADALVGSFDREGIPITVDTLMAFLLGATVQAAIAGHSPLAPVQQMLTGQKSGVASPHVMAAVAFVAADLLAGNLE
jgi:hypothetical protein